MEISLYEPGYLLQMIMINEIAQSLIKKKKKLGQPETISNEPSATVFTILRFFLGGDLCYRFYSLLFLLHSYCKVRTIISTSPSTRSLDRRLMTFG